MPALMGISHVDLTVSDCERAAAWWQDVVGLTLVNRVSGETFEAISLVHPSGFTVTVMTHKSTAELGLFDERRIGLDHLAFRVANRDELQRWATHLEAKGVPHTGIIDHRFTDPLWSSAILTTRSSNSLCTRTSSNCSSMRGFER